MKENEYISKRFKNMIHIFIPTWTRNLYYINERNMDKYLDIINKEFDKNYTRENFRKSQASFCTIEKNGQNIGVIRCPIREKAHLMHECLHATFWIMEDIGIELCEKSEEAFCYTQMMIYNEICRHFK